MPDQQPIKLDYTPRETTPKNGWFFYVSCALLAILFLAGMVQAVLATIEGRGPFYEGIIAATFDAAAITFFVWSGIRGKYPWR